MVNISWGTLLVACSGQPTLGPFPVHQDIPLSCPYSSAVVQDQTLMSSWLLRIWPTLPWKEGCISFWLSKHLVKWNKFLRELSRLKPLIHSGHLNINWSLLPSKILSKPHRVIRLVVIWPDPSPCHWQGAGYRQVLCHCPDRHHKANLSLLIKGMPPIAAHHNANLAKVSHSSESVLACVWSRIHQHWMFLCQGTARLRVKRWFRHFLVGNKINKS